MATLRLPILGPGTRPDTSGDVFQSAYSVHATNDLFPIIIWAFNNSGVKDGLHGGFAVPVGYVDTANLIVVWTSGTAAGTITWDYDYSSIGGIETLDPSSAQRQVTSGAVSFPATAHNRVETSISLTDADFNAKDTVLYTLFRDSPNDTKVDEALLFELFFEYNDA